MSTPGTPLPGGRPRVSVALAAGTARWESEGLAAIAAAPTRVTLVKRCLDLPDLLAVAATGTVRVALVDRRLSGLDGDSVERLRRAGVRTVVVVEAAVRDVERRRLERLGVAAQVAESSLDGVAGILEAAAARPLTPPEPFGPVPSEVPVEPRATHDAGSDPGVVGRVLAVWGPHGAPGRTTVAIELAAEAAATGVATTLVDADPFGGAVGQHLAVLDEASGLLAAVRLANAGQLDAARLVGVARQLAPGLRLLTGLPRPDRWREVRPHTLTATLDAAATVTPWVVVDAGSGFDPRDHDGRPETASRDRLSTAVLAHADDLVVVASADPVGLTRLARALLDLRDVRPGGPLAVVVNRMRPGLGWAERDVVDMVARVAPNARVAFLPEDRSAADRALVSGRTLREGGDGALRRATSALAAAVLTGVGLAPPPVSRRRRRGGRQSGRRSRDRVAGQTVSSR